MPKCIVIGGGFGGMAAALRMRKKGYDVTLIDKGEQLGGRATQYRRETPHGTFVHDAGPTVITAKFLFDELFELFGKNREDYVEFRDIYPWYRIVFAGEVTKPSAVGWAPPTVNVESVAGAEVDNAHQTQTFPFFDYGGTLEQFEAQIAKFEPKDVAGFRKFLAHSKKIFDVGFTQLGDQPFDQFTTMLKCAPALLRLQNYKTVYGMASKYISNEKLRRVFSFQPLLVGGNPFNTTSIYSLIFYLERQWGVQFAMGGTGAIVRGLEKLMREEGIEIRLGEEVKRILVECHVGPVVNYWVQGVELASGEQVICDRMCGTVVCNADTPYAYKNMIYEFDALAPEDVGKKQIDSSPFWSKKLAPSPINAPRRVSSMKYSMGLFVLYFGTTRQYPGVAHHTIVLGHEYKKLITTLFDTRELETEDLSVYLHRPTATDVSMAPPGMESFYVLVPVPNLQPNRRKTHRRGFQPVSSSADQHESETRATAEQDIPLMPDGVIDWSKYGDTFREHVINYLDRTVLPGLRECIVDAFYVTPKHFEQNLNTLHGSGFSIQPIFSQSAWFRFHNKAPGIEGLYFVGAGTHPGAGMPGVLCSAKVVEKLVKAEAKKAY